MLQRPGEMHAIWVFWQGPHREFAGWYVNIQEPFRRNARGYDTQDLELDIWIPNGGTWGGKDAELLEERVRGGRVTPEEGEAIWAGGGPVTGELNARRRGGGPW